MEPTNENPKASAKKSIVPRADIILKDVALAVSAKWKSSPQFTLHWTTSEAFAELASQFNTLFVTAKANDAGRDPITQKLQAMDKEITKNAGNLKIYLQDKYGKDEATAYFSGFGFERSKTGWVFPVERSKRTEALSAALQGIEAHGFSQKHFGQAYWTAIYNQYTQLVQQAAVHDGSLSGLVAQKNQLKQAVVKHLNALIHLIKANSPDDYEARLRDWGFQKEKY